MILHQILQKGKDSVDLHDGANLCVHKHSFLIRLIMHQRFQINKVRLTTAPVQQADAVNLNNDAALKTLQQRHNNFQTLFVNIAKGTTVPSVGFWSPK